MFMRIIEQTHCSKCNTLVEIREAIYKFPNDNTKETAYCPVCDEILYERNSRGEFNCVIISTENTYEPYKSEYLKKNL